MSMSFLSPEVQNLLQKPDWHKRERDAILDILFDDGTFNNTELSEIRIALALISKAELNNIDIGLQKWANRLQVAVELIAGVRLKWGNIFPN